jgi:hypothetical protein
MMGARKLAGVLGQCSGWLTSISGAIRSAMLEQRFAGVLGQCQALAHLNLSNNRIGAAGAGSLAAVLAQCATLAYLNLRNNQIFGGGAESLARVLPQCAALAHLDVRYNDIGAGGAKSLQECWRSAQRWLTSMSVAMISAMLGQRVLQE